MREMYRAMAKAKMKEMGYSKVNKRMRLNQWRRITGAWPVSTKTGEPMREGFHGKKRQKKGTLSGLFLYPHAYGAPVTPKKRRNAGSYKMSFKPDEKYNWTENGYPGATA